MFQFQWLRRFVRRHTTPMPVEYAGVWKQRLSYLYMFIAWNAFGIVLYNVSTGKANWAQYHGLPEEPGSAAQQWTRTLGIQNATVYRVSGTNIDKYKVHNEFDENTKEAKVSVILRDDEKPNTETLTE